MTDRKRSQWTAAGALVVMCSSGLLPRVAAAGEYSYTFAYAAEHSDNVRLTPTNKQDDWIHTLSTGFSIVETSRELDTRAQARAAYRYYQNDTFANDTNLGLAGTVVWKLSPEVLHWTAEDVYTQVASDPTQADTPANRVNANVFSTGPDFFWRLSPVQTVQLGGRYAVSTFDATANTAGAASAADNTRRSGTLRWFYRSSPVTTFSIGHLAESVEFDDSGTGTNLDFRRSETLVGVAYKAARNNFTLDLGETRIKRDGQAEVTGGSGRLSWIRELTSDTSFSLTASRSLSDTATELLAGSGGTLPTGTTSVSTSDIFVSKQINALYSRRTGTGTFSVSAFRAERVFELSTNNDEDSKGASVDYTQSISELLTGLASVRYVETLFPTIRREDKTTTFGVGLQYKVSRTLFGGLAVARQSRTSTAPTAEFVENRVALSLTYNSIPARW